MSLRGRIPSQSLQDGAIKIPSYTVSDQIASDLESCMAGGPVSVYSGGYFYPTLKTLRKEWKGWAAAGGVGAILLAAVLKLPVSLRTNGRTLRNDEGLMTND